MLTIPKKSSLVYNCRPTQTTCVSTQAMAKSGTIYLVFGGEQDCV